MGENRRMLKGEEEEPVGGSKTTEVESEEQNQQNEHYQWLQWEWCHGNGVTQQSSQGSRSVPPLSPCCHPASWRYLSGTFHSHSHLLIQLPPLARTNLLCFASHPSLLHSLLCLPCYIVAGSERKELSPPHMGRAGTGTK